MEKAGFDYLMPPSDMTRYGAVETKDEGLKYAEWLGEHIEANMTDVIMSLPNFSDENGADCRRWRTAACLFLFRLTPMKSAKWILTTAATRIAESSQSVTSFINTSIPFTIMPPHVVHPHTDAFAKNLSDFAAVCRVVNGMKRHFTIGVFGARTY